MEKNLRLAELGLFVVVLLTMVGPAGADVEIVHRQATQLHPH